jgi:hypothetical protein
MNREKGVVKGYIYIYIHTHTHKYEPDDKSFRHIHTHRRMNIYVYTQADRGRQMKQVLKSPAILPSNSAHTSAHTYTYTDEPENIIPSNPPAINIPTHTHTHIHR